MLGFPLSLLFFMDQNIAESMVNSPDNKLVKVITLLIIITSDSDCGLSLSHIIMAIFRLLALATLKRTVQYSQSLPESLSEVPTLVRVFTGHLLPLGHVGCWLSQHSSLHLLPALDARCPPPLPSPRQSPGRH